MDYSINGKKNDIKTNKSNWAQWSRWIHLFWCVSVRSGWWKHASSCWWLVQCARVTLCFPCVSVHTRRPITVWRSADVHICGSSSRVLHYSTTGIRNTAQTSQPASRSPSTTWGIFCLLESKQIRSRCLNPLRIRKTYSQNPKIHRNIYSWKGVKSWRETAVTSRSGFPKPHQDLIPGKTKAALLRLENIYA